MANAMNSKVTISADLAKVIGSGPMGRMDVTKVLWEYIKKNNLQNPVKKSEILADANLKVIFGKDSATMFEMTKFVNKHLTAIPKA